MSSSLVVVAVVVAAATLSSLMPCGTVVAAAPVEAVAAPGAAGGGGGCEEVPVTPDFATSSTAASKAICASILSTSAFMQSVWRTSSGVFLLRAQYRSWASNSEP